MNPREIVPGLSDIVNPPALVAQAEADLQVLASKINAAHEAGDAAVRKGLEHYRAAGADLLKAKAACGHGNWLAWLKANIVCDYRCAARYMALAKCDVTSNLTAEWQRISGNCAKDEARQERGEAEQQAEAEALVSPPDCHVEHARMQDFLPSLSGVDAIITDPPYSEEFLPLYSELARLARQALAAEGILAVMCGGTHDDEARARMIAHLPFRWRMAYLVPGGQAAQVWPPKVNVGWKPVLLFGGAPHWIGDVVRSDVNDNDKRHHHWGQSESGMADLVRALTRPGQLVCDPFLGGGTTAAVCVRLGRRFVGCDVDAACVESTRRRVGLDAKQGGAS